MKKYLPYYGTFAVLLLFVATIVLVNGGTNAFVFVVLIPTCILILYLIIKYFSALWADILLSVTFVFVAHYFLHLWLYTIVISIGCVLVIVAEHIFKSKKMGYFYHNNVDCNPNDIIIHINYAP